MPSPSLFSLTYFVNSAIDNNIEVGKREREYELGLARARGMVEYADILGKLWENSRCLHDDMLLGSDGVGGTGGIWENG